MTRLVAILLPLCLDTFAAAAALALAGLTTRQRLQVSLLFPAAETAMPVLGLVIGLAAADAVGAVAGWAAAVVIGGTGAYLLAEAGEPEPAAGWRLARGWALLALAIAISVDELALGLGVGLLRLPFTAAVIMIGVQAVVATQLGLLVGGRVAARTRSRTEGLAGFALVAIAIFLFFERLSS